jgi:hypothetical protein
VIIPALHLPKPYDDEEAEAQPWHSFPLVAVQLASIIPSQRPLDFETMRYLHNLRERGTPDRQPLFVVALDGYPLPFFLHNGHHRYLDRVGADEVATTARVWDLTSYRRMTHTLLRGGRTSP